MMVRYWLLPHPGANSVFFEASEALAQAELTLCLRKVSISCEPVPPWTHAGIRWYGFDAEQRLAGKDLQLVSSLSSLYALFLQEGELLAPVAMDRETAFGEDLSAILKYTGKTNTLFTRLMLHIAELSLPYEPQGRLSLLDPVAGKGTTLFEGLMRGWDASGVEIVNKAAHDAAVYFQKYLETEKWKHKLQRIKSYGAPTWQIAFAHDKEGLKQNPAHWTMVAGDSKSADRYFGKAAFDLVVGDLPYGVAHGNVTGASLTRSPKGLLHACLPAWHAVLRSRGVLALSWNTLVFPTVDMVETLQAHGFECLRDAPYDQLVHRVDASIRRDIVVARKAL